MSEFVYAGLTSQSIDIFLQDSSSSVGAGLSGLVFNSAGLVASYRKGATGSRVAITLATQTVGGAYSSGGFVEIDATNMKGVYRLDLVNAMVDTEGFVTLYMYGATNLLATAMRIDCRAVPADMKKINAVSTSPVTTVKAVQGLEVDGVITTATNVTTVNGLAVGVITAASIADNAIDTATFAAGTTIPRVTLVDTLTTYTGNTPQTGDSFARIGANGASLTALATAAQVSGLAINTRANLQIPIEIETPDAATQGYKIRLHLFDVEGNMETPDSTPTITLTNAAGTDRSSRLSAASNPSSGVYTWDYTATAGDAEEQLVWVFTVVEGGLTRTYPATSYVVEESAYRFSATDRATLNAAATATALASLVTTVGVAGAGLTAADDAVMARLGAPAGASVSADIAAVKVDTGYATDRLGFVLSILAGACADPQTAAETYAITINGSTFTVDMAGLDSTGTRTAPTLTKS